MKKKLIFSIGTLLTLTVPIATTISCGNKPSKITLEPAEYLTSGLKATFNGTLASEIKDDTFINGQMKYLTSDQIKSGADIKVTINKAEYSIKVLKLLTPQAVNGVDYKITKKDADDKAQDVTKAELDLTLVAPIDGDIYYKNTKGIIIIPAADFADKAKLAAKTQIALIDGGITIKLNDANEISAETELIINRFFKDVDKQIDAAVFKVATGETPIKLTELTLKAL